MSNVEQSNSKLAWSVDSWKSKPAQHLPDYDDDAALERALTKLRSLPPLVTSWEVETLKSQLAEAACGQRFVLQGGDCAETLADCTSEIIANKLKVLLQMSLVLVLGAQKPVVRVGRFAGQYAKPRSSPTETRDTTTLPSYFGDLVNEIDFLPETRLPNPHLLVRGYQHAAMTLNFIRSLIDAGFADLHHPEYWDLGSFHESAPHQEYEDLVSRVREALKFMELVAGQSFSELTRVEFFTSHEGLNLYYESAGTRTVPRRTGHYNLTTHFPWIGDRTRQLDGAHIEYFRGIRNPIGVKLGPSSSIGDVERLIETLNPERELGRLTFIHRFGADRIGDALPPLLDAVKASGAPVLWICDPMHGNTKAATEGRKTRDFGDILNELNQAFDIHAEAKTILGGVHFELTGEPVTECTGGARGLSEHDLRANYRTHCDPRLNGEQSLEMAFLIARRLQQQRVDENGRTRDIMERPPDRS